MATSKDIRGALHHAARIAFALVLLHSGAARAAVHRATAAPTPRVETTLNNRWGLSLSPIGFPNGASVELLYRPVRYVRLGIGPLYNYIGWGIGGSVTVSPHWWVAPSFTLEAGHFFETNALDKIQSFVTVNDNVKPLLEKISYTYVNAQLGLELGQPDTFVFFIRAGLSRLWGTCGDYKVSSSSSETYLSEVTNPEVTIGLPTAKFGFAWYFF